LNNEKSAQRDANTARDGCSKVRTPPAHLPARPLQTHRQDRLQYIAPLASAQCNNVSVTHTSCAASKFPPASLTFFDL